MAVWRSSCASTTVLHGGGLRGGAAAADRGEAVGALAHVGRQRALAALESEPRGLDLECDAQVGDVVQLPRAELRDSRAAVRLDLHEALGGECSQGGSQCVARDAVVVAQLLLPEARAG